MRMGGIEVAPRIEDGDDRLAEKIVAGIAHLRQPSPVGR
jgi:hypothetical protein